jgi:phosphotransferase family enzyme
VSAVEPAAGRSTPVARLLRWADQLGVGRVGAPDNIRERPWSTILRISTAGGPLWLKAAGPGSRYEASLLAVLKRHDAPHTVLPLAVDEERGFSLLPDAGEVLRATPENTLRTWQRLLAEHAELQRALQEAVPELLAQGVPDQRPAAFPGHLDRLLADPPPGLPPGALQRLRAGAPAFRRACADLSACGVAPTLQHDDLHDGNVLVDGDGTCRVSDWGDAAVAHPFGVLMVTLRSIADRSAEPLEPAALSNLRDAYLEPWTDRYHRDELREASRLAVHVGRVGRCLAWQRALLGASDVPEDFATAPAQWLAELLDGAPIPD